MASTFFLTPVNSNRYALVTTSIGVRVCVSILDKLDGLVDRPESGDEEKVFELVYVYILSNCPTSLTGFLDTDSSRGSFNWVSFQQFIFEHPCTLGLDQLSGPFVSRLLHPK